MSGKHYGTVVNILTIEDGREIKELTNKFARRKLFGADYLSFSRLLPSMKRYPGVFDDEIAYIESIDPIKKRI